MMEIQESGMLFGPFDEANCFHHERVLKEVGFGDHVKVVEFLLRTGSGKNDAVAFVEARSSIPRECDGFLNEVCLKMNHSLIVWFAAVVGRHPKLTPLLPSNLSKSDHLTLSIQCYLVIPDVPDKQLPPFTDKFRRAMLSARRLWPIRSEHIQVINQVRARKIGLIGVSP